MDYMLELASHPDMPNALNELRLRWRDLFATAPGPAGAGAGLEDLKKKWTTLFGPSPRPVPTSADDFERLKSRWNVTRELVEENLAGGHQNVGGVHYLIKEHPNVWIAQVVYEFYRCPELAADAWFELKYCHRFPDRLANHVRAHAGGWFAGHDAHEKAMRSADTIASKKPAATPTERESRRQEITRASERMKLGHEAPGFIQDIVDAQKGTHGWFGRTPPPGGESEEKRAYDLIADPEKVKKLAGNIPVPFSLVLQNELEQIRTTREWVRTAQDGERPTSTHSEPTGGQPAKQAASFRQALQENLLGLAFSGGGIRSATFNLGVLQSLAKIGLLKRCDYLSTVSGGGYIGGWFTAWMHRQSGTRPRPDAINDMQRRLSPVRNANPVADAVRPIRYLREYSNYLTPRTGFLSADTWTMIGIFTRNALLNQVILISLFAGLLLMPRVIVKIAGAGAGTPAVWTDWLVIALIVGLLSAATWILIKNLRRLDPLGSEDRKNGSADVARAAEAEVPKYARPLAIQIGVVLPWLLAMSLLILRLPDILSVLPASRVAAAVDSLGWPLLLSTIVAASAALYVALLLAFGKAARCWKGDRGGLVRSFGSAILVGGLAAGAVALALIQLFGIAGLDRGLARPWHAAVLGGPAAMLVVSILIIVVLGMLGEKFPDEHREWWSRFRTFIHMYTVGCLAWFVFALYVPWAWHRLQDYAQVSQWSGWGALLAWLGSTFAGVRAGGSAAEKNGDAPPASITTVVIRGIAFVAPYVFIVGLVVAISLVLDVIVRHDNPMRDLSGSLAYWTYVTQWNDAGLWMFGLTFGCFAVGLMFSYRVDINAFSMHHFYKNRLVRCYLGASHDDRKADWFTGFDPDDDLRLAMLDHAYVRDDKDDTRYPGPYPILNCALNLVGGKDLAWQERKAESFVFTPKYCGFDLDRAVLNKSRVGYAEAYVPTRAFYRAGEGPLLGMAMSISGAAANPNMGQATSPASAFLLTVFNARLGWWVGNTRSVSASQPGPPFGLAYTAKELTGSTDDENPFVNVSDGGHFENLGVYELIRRGCRYIIACDAGQDGDFAFQDLGNLVRRCRTDFGVEIDISLDRIRDRDAKQWSQVHCVVGTIHYLNIPKRNWRGQLLNEDDLPLRRGDRPSHEMGYLIYIKPSITGDEPHDVLEYGLRVPEFPHESTADQWFGEGQFEAYRRLGMHIGECAFNRFLNDDRTPVRDIGWLFQRLHKFWHPPTIAIAQHSTEHTQAYSRMMELVRTIPQLGFLDHTLFDGLPSTTLVSTGGAPLSPADERSEFYVVNSMIQLMEDVYADLHLEDNFDHPHVEGWMAVFRRWALQEAFQRTWAISRCTYAERFRRFYDDRLVKRRIKRRPLTFESNFIAAHRGRVAAGKVGNTMDDFRAAIAAKAEVIELDVRKLKDDTLVVFHDDTLGGTQLFTADYTAFRALPGGPDVPRLSDCLNELRGRVQLDIELKDPGSVLKVLEEVRKAAWNTDDFVITSFLPAELGQLRELREDVQVGLLLKDPNLADQARRVLQSLAIDFIAPEDGALTAALLDECAACGMPVVPWTVNAKPKIEERLRHAAVVGIITDEVALARDARKSVR